MRNKFFSIAPKEPWGDYGPMLITGMRVPYQMAIQNLPPEMQKIDNLEERMESPEFCVIWRTGPCCPDLSYNGKEIIVTRKARNLLSGQFPHLNFAPVVKGKVVDLRWDEWDKNNLPPVPPPDGEPESYLTDFPHSPEASEKIGPLHYIELHNSCEGRKIVDPDSGNVHLDIYIDTWNGDDFFYINRWPGKFHYFFRETIVSENGRRWMEQLRLDTFVRFKDCCRIVEGPLDYDPFSEDEDGSCDWPKPF